MSTAPLPMPSSSGTQGTHARRNNRVAVPDRTRGEAIQTLTSIAADSMLGAGQTFRTDIEELHNAYKLQVEEFIQLAFLYGSTARSEESSESDMYLMIVGDVGLFDLVPSLRRAERRFGRPINPTVYSS